MSLPGVCCIMRCFFLDSVEPAPLHLGQLVLQLGPAQLGAQGWGVHSLHLPLGVHQVAKVDHGRYGGGDSDGGGAGHGQVRHSLHGGHVIEDMLSKNKLSMSTPSVSSHGLSPHYYLTCIC